MGLFFMMSGALLLRPAVLAVGPWLRRRLVRVGVPLVLWTLIYLTLNTVLHDKWDGLGLQTLLTMPFCAQGNGVLWFLYTLVGLYLITPILDAWLLHASRRQVKGALTLWVVTLCVPWVQLGLDIRADVTFSLYYFSGYAGYYLLGYYLRTWRDALPLRRIWPLTVLAVIAPVTVKMLGWEVDFYALFWYLSPWVAIMCVTIWKVVRGACERQQATQRLVKVSQLTFGVYLLQMLFIHYWLFKAPFVMAVHPYPLRAAVVAVITFACSLTGAYLLSLLPLSDYFIGAHTDLFSKKQP